MKAAPANKATAPARPAPATATEQKPVNSHERDSARLEERRAALKDPRLPIAQRRAIAVEIGRLEGNLRLDATMAQDEAQEAAVRSARSDAINATLKPRVDEADLAPATHTDYSVVEVDRHYYIRPKDSVIELNDFVPGKWSKVRLHFSSIQIPSGRDGKTRYRVHGRLYYQETGLWQEFEIPAEFEDAVNPKVLHQRSNDVFISLGPTLHGGNGGLGLYAYSDPARKTLDFSLIFDGGPPQVFQVSAAERKNHGEQHSWIMDVFDWGGRKAAQGVRNAGLGVAGVYDLATGRDETVWKVDAAMNAISDDFQPATELAMAARHALEIETRSLDYINVLIFACQQVVEWVWGGKFIDAILGIFKAGYVFLKAAGGETFALFKAIIARVAKTNAWKAVAEELKYYFATPEGKQVKQVWSGLQWCGSKIATGIGKIGQAATWVGKGAAWLGKGALNLAKRAKERIGNSVVGKYLGKASDAITGANKVREVEEDGRKTIYAIRQVKNPETGEMEEVADLVSSLPLWQRVKAGFAKWRDGNPVERIPAAAEKEPVLPSSNAEWLSGEQASTSSAKAAAPAITSTKAAKPVTYRTKAWNDPETMQSTWVEDVSGSNKVWNYVKPDLLKSGTWVSMSFAAGQNVLQQYLESNANEWDKLNKEGILIDMLFAAIGGSFASKIMGHWSIGISKNFDAALWAKNMYMSQKAFYLYGSMSSMIRAHFQHADANKLQMAGQIKAVWTLSRSIALDSYLQTAAGSLLPEGRKNGKVVAVTKLLDFIIDTAIRSAIGSGAPTAKAPDAAAAKP